MVVVDEGSTSGGTKEGAWDELGDEVSRGHEAGMLSLVDSSTQIVSVYCLACHRPIQSFPG